MYIDLYAIDILRLILLKAVGNLLGFHIKSSFSKYLQLERFLFCTIRTFPFFVYLLLSMSSASSKTYFYCASQGAPY